MWKKLKLSYDGGNYGSKKCKWGYGGVWQSLCSLGVWSWVVGFVLVHLTGICFSRHEDVFNLNYLIKKFYKFCTSNVVCKNNAMNCIAVQHKKGSFPSALIGHTALVTTTTTTIIQFNSLLLVCCINSQKANYRCSTRE
jgi:hypothetical protein